MDGDSLPDPKRKKTDCTRERKYPFPLCEISTSDPTGNPKTELRTFIGKLQNDCVLVTDEESMEIIFSMGYFGKGTLSRSEPSYCPSQGPTACSSQCHGIENVSCSDPDVCKAKHKANDHNHDPGMGSPAHAGNFAEVEYLQLTFEEAFFLSYGLGRLVVMDKEQPLDIIKLWQKFCELSPKLLFPAMYTVYHHFRSKGWVVRCGIKYGADYVLYKEGPPFYHSTYTVIVKPVREKNLEELNLNDRMPMTWATLSAITRINAHTAKYVLFAYVIMPDLTPEQMSSPLSVYRFKVQEQIVRRWVPNKDRE